MLVVDVVIVVILVVALITGLQRGLLASLGTILGLVAGESAGQITLRVGDQQRTIRSADVKSRQESRVSQMPEGLLDALSLQQIADLLEYLATLK